MAETFIPPWEVLNDVSKGKTPLLLRSFGLSVKMIPRELRPCSRSRQRIAWHNVWNSDNSPVDDDLEDMRFPNGGLVTSKIEEGETEGFANHFWPERETFWTVRAFITHALLALILVASTAPESLSEAEIDTSRRFILDMARLLRIIVDQLSAFSKFDGTQTLSLLQLYNTMVPQP